MGTDRIRVAARLRQPDVSEEQFGSSKNEEASQRAGFLAELPDLLRELGANPVELLVSAGVDAEGLDTLDNRIPFVPIGRLLHECNIRTRRRDFALLLGQRARLSQLGLPGQLARHSPTVRDAIRTFAVYQHLNSEGVAIYLLERDGVAMLGPVVCQMGIEHVELVYDVCAAAILAIMREFCSAGWRPDRMLFSHSKPANRDHTAAFSTHPVDSMPSALLSYFRSVCSSAR